MRKRTKITRLNPWPVTRKAEVTDRAKRYRANQPGVKPKGPKVCAYCGARRNVEVHHKDGDEGNGHSRNLAWACRSCNTSIGVQHARAGKGKRTAQYNPKPIPTFEQYARAVSIHRRGRKDEGGKIIHATPPAVRSEYARLIAALKRERGTSGGRNDVPF